MENIEVKRAKNKRSIESLIEDSAIDSSFNQEAHELRKAFNETLMALNAKEVEKQKEIEKLRILVREHDQNKARYESQIRKLQEELTKKHQQYAELSNIHQENKKKLQYLEYKFECFSQNRSILDQGDSLYQPQSEKDALRTKRLKNQIYSEFAQIIAKKIQDFTNDLQKITISQQAENRIEAFLEQLLYINPYSQLHIIEQLKQENRQHAQGRISEALGQISRDQDQWQLYQNSLEKLRSLNQQHMKQGSGQKASEQKVMERSLSPHRRRRLFL